MQKVNFNKTFFFSNAIAVDAGGVYNASWVLNRKLHFSGKNGTILCTLLLTDIDIEQFIEKHF